MTTAASAEDDLPGPAALHDAPELTDALNSNHFRKFLDLVPFAVAVSDLRPAEHITYANPEFERLSGGSAADLKARGWQVLAAAEGISGQASPLSDSIVAAEDYLGRFLIRGEAGNLKVEAWSNLILGDDGRPRFRLVALAALRGEPSNEQEALEQQVIAKDTQLRELQHRVKNNLQMITALIRMEARHLTDRDTGARFDRLAGRVGALALLYDALAAGSEGEDVDLGVYLSQIASAVMAAHAPEGIHLTLQVDTWPVSINVAMPTGLVVNELLTNALKHAFDGRAGGNITVSSIVENGGCRVTVTDDGVGLGQGVEWPTPGKLSSLIVDSLRENAKAKVDVRSSPGEGVAVSIYFSTAAASP